MAIFRERTAAGGHRGAAPGDARGHVERPRRARRHARSGAPQRARLNDIRDTLKDGEGGGPEIDYKKLAKEVAPLLAADLARRLSNG